jgi:diguanylate cyclase (GGDEF)-like protein
MRLLLTQVLEGHGFIVFEATNGLEAFDRFAEISPDAVLLDISMPEMDGFTVCEKIRASEELHETPILLITATDDIDSVERAFRIGATDFIAKPINWPALPYRLQHILRAAENQMEMASLISGIPDMIFVLDNDATVLSCRSRGTSQQSIDELMERSRKLGVLMGTELADIVANKTREVIRTGIPQEFEHRLEGDSRHYETRLIRRDKDTALAIVRDISARKQAEYQIQRLAYYDTLTGLPNRDLFANELNREIRRAKRTRRRLGLLYIDLDRFKRINDTLGHSAGDELLNAVAKRLDNSCRTDNRGGDRNGATQTHRARVARLGGDEFTVMLTDIDDAETAARIAARIRDELVEPFSHRGHQFVVSPSIGIAIYPDDGDNLEDLLKNADTAMYQAKQSGRNNYRFYTDTMNVESLERLNLENELRIAIENNQLKLHLQPKIRMRDWKISGAEALLRWEHAELGRISPGRFIPVAEDTGLIVPLGQWVVQEACRQLREWRGTAMESIQISVNISGQQFRHDDMRRTILSSLWSAGIRSRGLELEITESVLMQDTEDTMRTLRSLREAGVSLAIDDFGTGYSSFSYLNRFPIDKIKIDRSFVANMTENKDDASICAAIVAMAHQLGLKVIAEGVETREQMDMLRNQQCDEIQGFYVSKAVSAEELEELVTQQALDETNIQ